MCYNKLTRFYLHYRKHSISNQALIPSHSRCPRLARLHVQLESLFGNLRTSSSSLTSMGPLRSASIIPPLPSSVVIKPRLQIRRPRTHLHNDWKRLDTYRCREALHRYITEWLQDHVPHFTRDRSSRFDARLFERNQTE